MEATALPLLVLLLALALPLFLLIKLAARSSSSSSQPGRKQRLPPGPWQLPLIGSLHHLLLSRHGGLAHRAMRDLSRRHGPVMLLRLGAVPTVVVSSAEAAREVMKAHDAAFASRHLTPTLAVFSVGGRDVLFSPYGVLWRQLRRVCVLELLSPRRVQSFRRRRRRRGWRRGGGRRRAGVPRGERRGGAVGRRRAVRAARRVPPRAPPGRGAPLRVQPGRPVPVVAAGAPAQPRAPGRRALQPRRARHHGRDHPRPAGRRRRRRRRRRQPARRAAEAAARRRRRVPAHHRDHLHRRPGDVLGGERDLIDDARMGAIRANPQPQSNAQGAIRGAGGLQGAAQANRVGHGEAAVPAAGAQGDAAAARAGPVPAPPGVPGAVPGDGLRRPRGSQGARERVGDRQGRELLGQTRGVRAGAV